MRREEPALGLGLGAMLLALFVHSLAYSGFFEDPRLDVARGRFGFASLGRARCHTRRADSAAILGA